MRIKAGLGMKTNQSLRLTPGVQLALKFLQIPALELRAHIDREIVANPLLEIEEEEESPAGAQTQNDENEAAAAGETEAEPPEWPEFLPQEPEAALPRGLRERPEPGDRQPLRPAVPTLFESMTGQLRLAVSDPEIIRISEYLIGCLDDRGYLGCDLEQAAVDLGADPDKARTALEKIQGLDPPGIGARDLRECLLLQLRARNREDSLAGRIVALHFDRLARRRHTDLSRKLRVSLAQIEAAIDEIRRLKPHPGRLVAPDDVRYIYPDLIVTRIGDRYEVFPSDRSVPRLRVNPVYRSILGETEGRMGETGEYLRGKLRSARWLVQALDRRRDTMLRVMRAIVEEQGEFLVHGTPALKPLTLQVVARRVGMHESTVARVAKSKYVQTPRGIFSLKFFFSSRIQTQLGGDTSSRAVGERIRSLIQEEDICCPLSDDAIAEVLGNEGVRIARRTVAKYRDRMGIERAQRRRRHQSSDGATGASTRGRRRIA